MKITDVKTFVVGNPPPGFGGRYFVFLKLITDEGIEGLGEVYSLPFHPSVVEQMIKDVVERCVIGRDPYDTERIWRSVYGSGFIQRPDISMMGILSGIEMACWDIVGKDVNKPVYKLLGGQVHEKLRSYTYIYPKDGDKTNVYADPVLAAERAAEYLKMGFTALKFDPAGPYSIYDGRQLSLTELDRSETFCRMLREAVGTQADLLFGTHGQMTAAGAIRLARRLEKYDPLWFEEPIPPDNQREMGKVARGTTIPVACGERLTTKWEFVRVLEEGAAAILQMNLGRVGGILEGKKQNKDDGRVIAFIGDGSLTGGLAFEAVRCGFDGFCGRATCDAFGWHHETFGCHGFINRQNCRQFFDFDHRFFSHFTCVEHIVRHDHSNRLP